MSGKSATALPETRSHITKYLDLLYESTVGYVYIPTQDPKDKIDWTPQFFHWPEQREAAVEHILSNLDRNVYISPAMYKQPTTSTKENVLGSHVAWVDVDGTFNPKGLPAEPYFMVRSSAEKNHMHFYYLMSSFETDVDKIEQVNKMLAYRCGADRSGWDATQVLRPPSTFNHKRGTDVSGIVMNREAKHIPWAEFVAIPVPVVEEKPTEAVSFEDIPQPNEVLGKYSFPDDFIALFNKARPEDRSAALMAVGYYGAELQLSNEEIMSLLLNADERWGKYKSRQGWKRLNPLLDIIARARQKFPFSSIPEQPPVAPRDFWVYIESQEEPDWAITDLLDKQGLMVWSGPPGCGKTHASLQFGLKLATGQPYCGFETSRPQKIAFISLEMSDRQLGHIARQTVEAFSFSKQDQRLIGQNFTVPEVSGHLSLDTAAGIDALAEFVTLWRPDGIIIDSLSMVTAGDLNDDNGIRKFFGSLNELSRIENFFTWVIHHTRKGQVGNTRPNKLSDVYGSQYITAYASTVVSMWPLADQRKEMRVLKNRMALSPLDQFEWRRDGILFVPDTVKVEAPKVEKEVKKDDKSGPELFGIG